MQVKAFAKLLNCSTGERVKLNSQNCPGREGRERRREGGVEMGGGERRRQEDEEGLHALWRDSFPRTPGIWSWAPRRSGESGVLQATGWLTCWNWSGAKQRGHLQMRDRRAGLGLPQPVKPGLEPSLIRCLRSKKPPVTSLVQQQQIIIIVKPSPNSLEPGERKH